MATPSAWRRPGINLADNLGPSITITALVFLGITLVSVIARFISKRIKRQSLEASDWVLLVGLFFSWWVTATDIFAVTVGLGQHIEVVPTAHIRFFLLSTWLGNIAYPLTLAATKCSILFFYLGIFPGPHVRLGLKMVGAFVTAWAVASVFTTIFSCSPIRASWDTTVPSVCIDRRKFLIGQAVTNILADAIILCMPIRPVCRLQLPPRQKIAVLGMFLLGGFVIIASCVRLNFALAVSDVDPTWYYSCTYLWSSLEVDTAIISACLPTLRPLMAKILPRSFSGSPATRASAQSPDRHPKHDAARFISCKRFRGHSRREFQTLDDRSDTTSLAPDETGEQAIDDALHNARKREVQNLA